MHIVQCCHFMCGPYVVTLLNWTHIFEWYQARFVVHDTPKRHQMYDEIGPCVWEALICDDHFLPTPRGVSSHASLLLCPEGIIPRVGRTGISIMLIIGQRLFSLSLSLSLWWPLKGKDVFVYLDKPYNFCISNLIWNLTWTILLFTIAKYIRWFHNQSNGQNCMWRWNSP